MIENHTINTLKLSAKILALAFNLQIYQNSFLILDKITRN